MPETASAPVPGIDFAFTAWESGFIPYADLTKEIVVGWVKDYFGEEKVAEIEAALANQIQEKLHPTNAAGVPWTA
jgi:hypothetical protein